MGAIELTLGNLTQASRFYREALELCQARGSRSVLALSLHGLARIALPAAIWLRRESICSMRSARLHRLNPSGKRLT